MSKNSNRSETTPMTWSLLLLLGGLILIFLGLYLEKIPENSSIFKISIDLIKTIGTTLIVSGLFSILLDFKDWRNYFSSRLSEIVVENTYLEKLDSVSLEKLQNDVLKAQFGNNEIDKEGSFLHFFQKHLHKFISQPYREQVSSELVISDLGGSLLQVYDKVSYTCKASANEIQSSVKWASSPGEFEDILNLHIKVFKPGEKIPAIEEIYDKDRLTPDFSTEENLAKLKGIDGVRVCIEATYTIKANRFQYWQMAHPTKDFDITINYPKNYTIQHQSLFVDQNNQESTDKPGYFKVKYSGWLLPDSGIAWDLRPAIQNS